NAQNREVRSKYARPEKRRQTSRPGGISYPAARWGAKRLYRITDKDMLPPRGDTTPGRAAFKLALEPDDGEPIGARGGVARQAGDGSRLQQPKGGSVVGPLDVLGLLPVAKRPVHPLDKVGEADRQIVAEHFALIAVASPIENDGLPAYLDDELLRVGGAAHHGFAEPPHRADRHACSSNLHANGGVRRCPTRVSKTGLPARAPARRCPR